MSRNSNEKLAVAEAEASLKGSESLDPENSGRTDMLWGTIYFKSWKGGFTASRQTSSLRRFQAPSLPQKKMLSKLLHQYYILHLSQPLLHPICSPWESLPSSNPFGKFLPLPGGHWYPNCLHWEAAPSTKAGIEDTWTCHWIPGWVSSLSETQFSSLEEHIS